MQFDDQSVCDWIMQLDCLPIIGRAMNEEEQEKYDQF